jgi:hypothetical protein
VQPHGDEVAGVALSGEDDPSVGLHQNVPGGVERADVDDLSPRAVAAVGSNDGSRSPFLFSRRTAMWESLKPTVVSPATTILPSGWCAAANAMSGVVTGPNVDPTVPSSAKAVSKDPSGFSRANAK